MKKKMLLLILFITFVVGIRNVNAVEIVNDDKLITYENKTEYICKNQFGEMYIPDNLEYDNKNISLFCEYKDDKSAMEKYILENQKIVSYIEDTYNIEPLNSNNWEKYKEYIILILNENDIDEDLLKQAKQSRVFFGLYENKYTNITITKIIDTLKENELNSKNKLLIYKLNELTPYYSEKIAEPTSLIYAYPNFDLLTILAIIIYIFWIYKIITHSRQMEENKDQKIVLIIKQVFNGIALSFFIKITLNKLLPLDVYWYKEFPDMFYSDVFSVLIDILVLSIIFVVVCIALALYKKNINEYLKLITYSEIIIIPLLLFGVINFTHLSPLIYNFLEKILRMFNISLPMIFYLKFTNKKLKR